MFRSGFSLRVWCPADCAKGCAVQWQGWGGSLTVPLPASATAEESMWFLADELVRSSDELKYGTENISWIYWLYLCP